MTLPYFRTVKHQGFKEVVIKKSRFIGHAKPVESEEEAVRFIEEIRKEHGSATHNCFAYCLGERDEVQKQSDDGEPSGTAGKPILEVIKNQQMKNVAIVVTRYFGGIMLGAGGLIRAYTDGAVAALESAGHIYRVLHTPVEICIDYTWHGKVENELRNRQMHMGETKFTDKVTLTCYPLAEQAEAFVAWMTDLTQGQGMIASSASIYLDHDRNVALEAL
ncbi:YigZ family protein [Marinicrinis sediminis]|uniref:YigZ family protein n=1 Tax=Marinicrinis sediminis TaxID=1652465 RepID=A0ABW5R8S2_9BACL